MSLGVAVQAVVSGLAQGVVYGLVGLGFSLCFRLVRVLNFAHGDVVVGTVFVAVLATVGSTPVVEVPGVPRAAAQVLIALAAGAALGGALYLGAVRPFARGNRGDPGNATDAADATAGLGWVAATIAGGLLIRELLGLAFTREAYAVADPLRLPGRLVDLPGGGSASVRFAAVLGIGLLAGVAVERFVVLTRTGRAMRAVAEDRETAMLLGVPADRVVLLAFALAGLLAGLAGLLAAPAGPLSVRAGVVLGLKGTAAALLGGLGSLRGALLGGLLLGAAEALAVSSTLFGTAYRDVLALGVLVVVLALRPEGLGRRFVEQVE